MKENIDTEWKLHLLTIIARNGNVNELLYGDYDLQYLLRQLRVFVEEGFVARVENSYRARYAIRSSTRALIGLFYQTGDIRLIHYRWKIFTYQRKR